MRPKLYLIAATCENSGGIGMNGRLPWKLKREMEFFTRMTSKSEDRNKKNVVLMGRKTWDSIPSRCKPLINRINVVLTTRSFNYGSDAIACKSIAEALNIISRSPLCEHVNKVWVIGGSSVYKAALESPNFHRLYITRIKKHFDCDVFFPELPSNLSLIRDPDVPEGIQEENGIRFEHEVYEKKETNYDSA